MSCSSHLLTFSVQVFVPPANVKAEFKRSKSVAMLQKARVFAIQLGGPVDPERLKRAARVCGGGVGWWGGGRGLESRLLMSSRFMHLKTSGLLTPPHSTPAGSKVRLADLVLQTVFL